MRFSAKPNALGRTRTATAQHKSRYSSQLDPEPHRSSKELSHENQRHYRTAHVNRCGHEQISLLKAKSRETWRFPGMETITTITTCFRDAGLELFPCNQEVPRLRLCPGRCRDNTILRKAYYRIGTGIRDGKVVGI
ncbi:hypothetical protein TWF102_006390 [Orbilia oligospora]|uniref:Uncharacterized protein n=1 Tax=Orbilia oligospora TaxID=2813651 RepID=A0A7C8NDJ6_ORBOL|nr:hypothetical protein TWF102_006390 [Orbilia oligospora]